MPAEPALPAGTVCPAAVALPVGAAWPVAVACPAAMLELDRERYRDIWDLWWLGRDDALEVDAVQVIAAIGSQNVAAYRSLADEFLGRLGDFVDSPDFAAAMRNLLNVELFEQMVVAPEGRRQIEEGAARSVRKAVLAAEAADA